METIIATGASLLLGGVGTAFVTHWLNRGRDHTIDMRKKGEELYLAADEYGRALGTHHFSFLPMLNGSIDYNQMLDLQIANPPKKVHGGLEKIEMLTRIYFPSLKPYLAELLAARDAFSDVQSAHKAEYKTGYADGREWMPRFSLAIQRAHVASEALKSAILDAAERYAERPNRTFTLRPDWLNRTGPWRRRGPVKAACPDGAG